MARRRSCNANITRNYFIATVGKTLIITMNRNHRELLRRCRQPLTERAKSGNIPLVFGHI